jgi:hypothetical protein
LVARELEAHNIPTVVIGSAKDIVEYCGVPRFLFSDFPLGNPAGPPYAPDLQFQTLRQAVGLLETATKARTTVTSSVSWTGDADWRPVYNRITPENRIQLAARGEARRREQDQVRLPSNN